MNLAINYILVNMDKSMVNQILMELEEAVFQMEKFKKDNLKMGCWKGMVELFIRRLIIILGNFRIIRSMGRGNMFLQTEKLRKENLNIVNLFKNEIK